MEFINKAIIVILLIFSFLTLKATPNHVIRLQTHDDLIHIGNNTFYLEDSTGNMEITDVLQKDQQQQFKAINQTVFSRPATHSAFWFKFTVENFSNEDAWIEVGSTYAWYIDFYPPNDSNQYSDVIQTGTMRPDTNKLQDVNLFWLPLNQAHDTRAKTYYVRIQSGLTYELPLTVGTIRSLSKNKNIFDYLTAGFLGLMIIMILYNAFIYLSTRDHIYLYYLGYLLLMSISMPYANNYPFIQNVDFLFFNKEWWNHNFLLWHPLVYYFIGVFCIKYLDLVNNSKWLRRIIQIEIGILSGLFPLLTLFGLKFDDLVNYIQPLILIFYLTCLVSGYYFAYKRLTKAYYYIAGWTFMVAGAFIFFAVINGYLPYNPFSRNALYFGSAIEIWMFSLALGNRLNILQKEKEKIQLQNIALINRQNEVLELKVKERTQDLEIKNIELAERNEELKSTTERLDIQSQQLKELNLTKDQMFAIIGHDLKSPLITLSNLIELADENVLTEQTQTEVFSKLKKNIEYLHFTLNNILEWAVAQMQGLKLNKQTLQLVSLSEEVRLMLKEYAATKNIQIKNCINKKVEVFADPDSVKLIFRNLLNNAIKFTNQGGTVSIKARIIKDICEISVSDTGIGIPAEKVGQLWEKKSLSSVFGTEGEKGTGLGLWLCQEFIEGNGGTIRVESTVNEGSTFFFTLPVNQSQ